MVEREVMKGVYIKNMQIPESCTACNIINCKEFTSKNMRGLNCPMTAITEETGRLVSVIELERIAKQELSYSSYCDVLWLIAHVNSVVE